MVTMDSTPQGTVDKMHENWVDLQKTKDAKGNGFYFVNWQCNYPLQSTNQSAWELP